MVTYIDVLTGPNLKKSLGAYKVVKRWHNKNKTGGNFGINIYPTQGAYTYNSSDVKAYELTGYHNLAGEITSLHFSELYGGGGMTVIPRDNYGAITYADVVNKVNELIKNGWWY